MWSKIVLVLVLIFGIWLTNHGCDAKEKGGDQCLNCTSVSVSGGNCSIYLTSIKFLRIEGQGKGQTIKPVVVYGSNLFNYTDVKADQYCGIDPKKDETGHIFLEYHDVKEKIDSKIIVLNNFTLNFEIKYNKIFRWWNVSSLTLTAVGEFTDKKEITASWAGALMKSMDIGASEKFCYACSKPSKLFYKPEGGTITYALQFEDLQIQPFKTPKAPLRRKPKDGFTDNINDCVGFFSAEVWMFLTTLFIFVSVILSGVVMLGNMTTVNRFDDPKAKMLVISEG